MNPFHFLCTDWHLQGCSLVSFFVVVACLFCFYVLIFCCSFWHFSFWFHWYFFFFPHWCRLDMHMLEMSNTMCRLPFAFIWTVYVQWCFVHPRLIKDRPQVADNLTCGEQLSKYSALKCQANVGSVCFDCSGNSLFRQRLHLSWLEIWRITLTCVSTLSRHSELTFSFIAWTTEAVKKPVRTCYFVILCGQI